MRKTLAAVFTVRTFASYANTIAIIFSALVVEITIMIPADYSHVKVARTPVEVTLSLPPRKVQGPRDCQEGDVV